MSKKKTKGEFGYLPYQRNMTIIRTVILFIMALTMFFVGYWWFKTKATIFSIMAVLVLLPACRSLVETIMYFKVPKYDKGLVKEITANTNKVTLLFQLYLTSYKKNFPISCFAVRGNHLIGYTEFSKCDIKACEEHIQSIFVQNLLKNVTVKIFDDKVKFLERVQQLEQLEPHKQDKDIASYITDISL